VLSLYTPAGPVSSALKGTPTQPGVFVAVPVRAAVPLGVPAELYVGWLVCDCDGPTVPVPVDVGVAVSAGELPLGVHHGVRLTHAPTDRLAEGVTLPDGELLGLALVDGVSDALGELDAEGGS
jgi:hypothetical protein